MTKEDFAPTVNVEESASEESKPQEEPAKQTAAQEKPETPVSNEEAAATEEKPEYTPNLKYKVLNEEKEFEDWAKPLVTSKEVEDQLRDLYSKAGGLDHIKQERDSAKKTLNERMETEQQVADVLADIDYYYKKGDIGNLMKTLKIPEEDLLSYAAKRAEYFESDEETRRAHDQSLEVNERLRRLETENQNYKRQLEQEQEAVRDERAMTLDNEINMAINSQTVSDVADAYDKRTGTKGSFRNAVIDHGIIYSRRNPDKLLTGKEYVDNFVSMLGIASNGESGEATQSTEGAATSSGSKPTIQKITASHKAAVKKVVESFDDLKPPEERDPLFAPTVKFP